MLAQIENQYIENMPTPKTAAEIIAEKNSIINDLQNEVSSLKKGISDLHSEISKNDQALGLSRKDLQILQRENNTLKIKLDYLESMHDELLERIVDKI